MSSVDIREVLKLQERKMSLRQIANRLGLHHTTVCRWVQRAKELGLDYQTVSKVEDQQLHSLFCKVKGPKEEAFYPVDVEAICDAIDQGRVKILDSYMQYLEQAKTSDLPPLKRSGFYYRVKQYWHAHYGNKGRVMAQEWEPGKYLLIDYAGDKILLNSSRSNAVKNCRVFVAVLPFSRMVYWYATPDMTTESWIEGLQNAFDFFKGVPSYIILDNDTALVNHAEKGNQLYSKGLLDLAQFYEVALSPARVGHPQDKGLVEEAVKDVTDKFIKKISPGSLTSVNDVNFLLEKELEDFNCAKMARYGISRRKWFELEQPKLRSLPKNKFFYGAEILRRKVRINGCIQFHTHEYMVPPEYFSHSVGVYVKDGQLLRIVDPLSNYLITEYKYYRPGEPDELEGFLHIKPEYRLPGELTPAGRLEKSCEEFRQLSKSAGLFLSKYLKINNRSEKGELANRLRYMVKKLKTVSPETLELSFTHAVETGIYEKSAFLNCVKAFATGMPTKKEKKKKTSENSECLRPLEEFFSFLGNNTIQ